MIHAFQTSNYCHNNTYTPRIVRNMSVSFNNNVVDGPEKKFISNRAKPKTNFSKDTIEEGELTKF